MLILEPIVHPTIWGGERLTPYSGSKCRKIGHLYSVFQSKGVSNKILNGVWKGRTLGEYFDKNRTKFHLGNYCEFPLIIALVEAADHLSIQVHPDDDIAQKLEGISKGKNESWYFLESPKSDKIYNGCICQSLNELEAAVKNNQVENVIDTLPVEKGDYVYIEAGTLHSMSAGSFVYEIEENTEITYRLYDFNRKGSDGVRRPLQCRQAIEAVHLKKKSTVRHYSSDPLEERRYVTQKYENIAEYINKNDTLECFTLLKGKCRIQQENLNVQMGQSVILKPGERLQSDIPIQTAIVARPKY